LTSTTTSGGKERGATSSRAFLEACEALLEEALPPLADDLAARVEAGRNFVVPQSLGGEEHDLGPDDVSIRQRISTSLGFELTALVSAELDLKRATSWHEAPPMGGFHILQYYVIIFMK
jgi:hypothetical protein